MNILMLTNVYPYEEEKNKNRTKVIAYFVRRWADAGHNVYVIVNSSSFPLVYYPFARLVSSLVFKHYYLESPEALWAKAFSYMDGSIRVENLPMRKWKPGENFSDSVIADQVERICASLNTHGFKPDVITGHWQNPQLALITGLKRRYHAKTAFVFHGDYAEELCSKHNTAKYLSEIDCIGCRSMSAAVALKEQFQLKKLPFVCSSGIPDEFVSKYVETKRKREFDGKLSILSAGRLVASKSIFAVIQATSETMSDDEYVLTIAGDGPLRNEYESYVKNNKLDNCIKFIGRIPRDDLLEFMGKCDVFVLISKRETFGLVYIEALLQGCIVIASRFGGVDGIIVDGVNGFLCKEGDKYELKRILQHIANLTPAEKQLISDNAVMTARKYTDSEVAARYLEQIAPMMQNTTIDAENSAGGGVTYNSILLLNYVQILVSRSLLYRAVYIIGCICEISNSFGGDLL